MNILITGGCGFIGFHLSAKLISDKNNVIIIDNMSKGEDLNLKNRRLALIRRKIKFYNEDILDMNALDKIFKDDKIDIIVHLAARAGVRKSFKEPLAYIRTNIVGTANILEMARRYNVPKVIFASSSSVYGSNSTLPFKESEKISETESIYASTKLNAERLGQMYSKLYGINFISLRFFSVYGPYGRPDMAYFKFTKRIMENKEIEVYNNGDMARDYTYVGDIVNGICLCLIKFKGSCTLNLGSGKSTELLELIKKIEKLTNKKAKISYRPIQKSELKITRSDNTLAMKLLGYHPFTNVDQGMAKFINWYKDYYRTK